MNGLTSQEMAMLQTIREKADELAGLVLEANGAGFNIQLNLNFAVGACDVFNVFKMTPIDLRSAAN